VIVGITDFTQKLAGTIKRIETFEEGDEVIQDKPFGTLSSGKWTGKVYSPVTGEIVEVNEDVEDDPKLLNDDPYGDGWLIKVSPSDLDADLKQLMKTGPDFESWYKKQIEEKEALIKK
jgi:glycine cleavage system H protein